jgi:cytochrome c peroxidase
MWRVFVFVGVVGCWTEDPLVDNTFTHEQWDFLQTFRLPEPQPCPAQLPNCADAAVFGQKLFFDPSLSGPIKISDPNALGPKGAVGLISCSSCHDPNGAFIDTRSQPGNISIGADYTTHNALSVMNIGFKSEVADGICSGSSDPHCEAVFTWNGRSTHAYDVFAIALKGAPMNSNEDIVAGVVRNKFAYLQAYFAAFETDANVDDKKVLFQNLAFAFESYFRQLNSINSKFDKYIAGTVAGDGTTSARDVLTDEERRGLAVFIGKGMCVECHRGPLLSDLKFHVTSVPQRGPHVPAIDFGLAEAPTKQNPPGPFEPEHEGEFLTQPLRNVALTAPYMHAGQFASLADVIDFYRRGGGSEGFAGLKDPRIQPLEIDDDEARDLEAFLRTLTGEPIPAALRKPI